MKYLFIDTNLYKTIFSSNDELSEDVFNLLIKLIDRKKLTLLLPKQTKEELERNCARRWPEDEKKFFENKIRKLSDELSDGGKKFWKYAAWKSMEELIGAELEELNKLGAQAQEKYLVKTSPQNEKIHTLFGKSVEIEETGEIVSAAELRLKKGNPPYNDNKIWDHLIWESLLSYLKTAETWPDGKELIFLTQDKAGFGNEQFDPWLEAELASKTTTSIYYIRKYSEIPELTRLEQEKIEKEEELEKKTSRISAFIWSDSWVEAGSNALKLLRIKDLLCAEDYEQILRAATTNSQIRGSFFTPSPLTELVNWEEWFVDKRLEGISLELWTKFKEKYWINLKRQTEEAMESSDAPP